MLELYQPRQEDLWFKEQMLSDAQTMAYNHAYGGTIPFPKEKWASWYQRWIIHHEDKRFYRYIKENGAYLGEVAYHFDDAQQLFLADVIIYAPHRGQGYGRQALALLCEAAKDNGVSALCDEIAIDNPAVRLFLACGFTEVRRTDASILVRKELR